MTIWNIEIDRVSVVGVHTQGLGAGAMRPLIEHAVRSALETVPLPNGRTMNASVVVKAQSLAGGAAIAGAVANGVSQAVGGRAHG